MQQVASLAFNKGLAVVVSASAERALLLTLGVFDEPLKRQEACLMKHMAARQNCLFSEIQILTADRTLY